MYIASQLVYTIYIFHYMSAERLQKKVHMFFELEKILKEVRILAHIIIDTTHLFYPMSHWGVYFASCLSLFVHICDPFLDKIHLAQWHSIGS